MDGQCVLKGHMPKQLYSIVQDLQVIHTSIQAVLVGKLLRQSNADRASEYCSVKILSALLLLAHDCILWYPKINVLTQLSFSCEKVCVRKESKC